MAKLPHCPLPSHGYILPSSYGFVMYIAFLLGPLDIKNTHSQTHSVNTQDKVRINVVISYNPAIGMVFLSYKPAIIMIFYDILVIVNTNVVRYELIVTKYFVISKYAITH